VAGLGGEFSAVSRAENRPAALEQAADALVVERDESPRLQQALETAEQPHGFPRAFRGRLGHRTDDRV